ncbi:serine hydrolase domain-containing protein [Cellulomonas fengjieae]|uniref:Beta-lactamase family protein n=1 Tax=Cellulomonas fengjieae TaxID=2819978 RepID=A0ABS3SGN1_9CELL|nr:serine hydrolase domain-containing protein [Cellulomonas fengjieae]MBO3084827.1 beta-lactamase family protein [Cellulomonas fengjieae]QVI66858.1 beta-lactamase family protein [Cellulomonas fengjieae]
MPLAADVDRIAQETGFAGVVRVDRAGATELDAAYGLADRRHALAMTTQSQLAIASGVKGMTALAVMSLVEEGTLTLATTARSLLGTDLPLVADDVTVEHLLGHRSGIGDYIDEESDTPIEAYLMPVPVHLLETTEQFLPVLDGFPTAFPAGERFAYCNSGFVVLALLAERASGVPFHDLVRERVCRPAGMVDTDFLRMDALPGRAAVGYVEMGGEWRTNALHMPVLGSGDGGIYSTGADLHRFWTALFAGRIVSAETVAEMVRPRPTVPGDDRRYGLGFWVHPTREIAQLEGFDAGVSFRSSHDPARELTVTVIGTTAAAAWPLATVLDAQLLD